MQKGIALEHLVKKQDALAVYTRVLEINPANADAWARKGVLLSDLGKIPDAIAAFSKALEINSGLRRDLDAQRRCPQYTGTDRKMQRMRMQRPSGWILTRKRAGSKTAGPFLIWEYQDAIDAFDNAITLNQRSTGAFLYKGFALEKINRVEEALQVFEVLLEIDAKNSEAHFHMGLALANSWPAKKRCAHLL